MARQQGKPEIGDIIKIASQLENDVYGVIRNEFATDEKVYELEFLEHLGLPKEFENDGIVLPVARDIVDVATDHTDISNARVWVNKKGITNADTEAEEMLRKLALGIIYRTNTESAISPWRVAAKHYWLHGVAFMKDVWAADMWPNKPIQKINEKDITYEARLKEWEMEVQITLPIIIQAINPYNAMPDPDPISNAFFIEKHKKLTFNIQKRFPKWSNPEGRSVEQDIEWLEYWDDTYKCFLADGEPVLTRGKGVVEHGYGFVPYVEIDAGLGNIGMDSLIEQRWVGLLRYMQDILVSQSRNFSINNIVHKRGAFPWYVGRDKADGSGRTKKLTKLDTSYGALNDLTGIDLEKQAPDDPSQSLMRTLALEDDIISSHSAPRSLRGLGETGVRSGSDRRLILAEAGMRYVYSKDSFKYGTAKVLQNCAKLIKNVVPANVKLWNWSSIKANEFNEVIDRDKLKEPFNLYVEFAPISDEDEYRRHDDIERLLNSKIITVETARKMISFLDPIEEGRKEDKAMIKDALMKGVLLPATVERGKEAIAPPQPPQPPPQSRGNLIPQSPQAIDPRSAQAAQQRIQAQQRPPVVNGLQGQFGGGNRTRTGQ